MKNVLDTITSYREARHWSNYDLASHAGIKPTTISSWYRKDIVPTIPTLLKICDAFGITLTEFFSVVESGEREAVVLTHEQAERKTKGLTQEQFAIKLNISDRHLGKIERGEGTASIDLLVEVAISLNTTLDFLILGVLDTPRERELNAQIKKQNQNIQNFKSKLNSLIDELDASA